MNFVVMSSFREKNMLFYCQVQAAFRGTDGNKASVSEGVEASVIYVRFKAAANEVIPFFFFHVRL